MTTRKKSAQTKEPDWDKTRKEFIGKGKVQALSVKPEGDRWRLTYDEGGGKIEHIDADSREELDKILIEFGGKNPDTVSAPDEFLVVDGSWGSKDLSKLGHIIQKISVRGRRVTMDSSFPVLLSEGGGHLQVINKKKGSNKPLQVNMRLQAGENATITLLFSNPEQFDVVAKDLTTNINLKNLSWSVTEMVTASKETRKSCKWKRALAGDGSKRMSLQLTHLDGVPYTKCVRQDLFNAADDMFDTECSKVPDARKKQDGSMVCYWAGKSGQLAA